MLSRHIQRRFFNLLKMPRWILLCRQCSFVHSVLRRYLCSRFWKLGMHPMPRRALQRGNRIQSLCFLSLQSDNQLHGRIVKVRLPTLPSWQHLCLELFRRSLYKVQRQHLLGYGNEDVPEMPRRH